MLPVTILKDFQTSTDLAGLTKPDWLVVIVDRASTNEQGVGYMHGNRKLRVLSHIFSINRKPYLCQVGFRRRQNDGFHCVSPILPLAVCERWNVSWMGTEHGFLIFFVIFRALRGVIASFEGKTIFHHEEEEGPRRPNMWIENQAMASNAFCVFPRVLRGLYR